MQEIMQEDEINFLEYWNVLWRRKYLLIALFIIFMIVTMVWSFQQPKFYMSETMIITSGSESGGLGAALSSLPFAGGLGGGGTQTPMDKIMVILKSRTIAEEVIKKFDLMKIFNDKAWDQIKGAWKSSEQPPLMEDAVKQLNSGIANFIKGKEGATITVRVEWKDPQLAADIANYYVYALTDFLKDKSMNINVQIVDRAVPAAHKSRPKIRQNMMLAGIMSLFIGGLIAFILEFFEKRKTQKA